MLKISQKLIMLGMIFMLCTVLTVCAVASTYTSASAALFGGKESDEYTGDIILSPGKLNHPAPQDKIVTSAFGYRIHPVYGYRKFHTGIDLDGGPDYSPIVAAEDGKVVSASYLGGYGNCIIISHDNKIWTLYAHLTKINVNVGSSVKRGQHIGIKGTTGTSTAQHLHFEVRVGSNTSSAAVNPAPWIK